MSRVPFASCPKCGHVPLPDEQALPAACPACGVILAKLVDHRPGHPAPTVRRAGGQAKPHGEEATGLSRLLFHVPDWVGKGQWWGRAALLAMFLVWGLRLVAMDHRNGEMGGSFLHGPLLVFHEAGHVLFRPFGTWMTILGGTLGQLIMPAVLCLALLVKNRDPFGAAMGLWLVGVSVLDVAPYLFDALHPQLTLLSGGTGEDGGHDWIYLLDSVGMRARAQSLGTLVHRLGSLVVLIALAWGGRVLWLQWGRRVDGHVPDGG